MPKQKTTTIEDIKSLIKKLPKEEFYLDKRELKHFIDAVSKDYNSEYYNGLSKKMTELYDSDNKRHHFISTLNISGSSHDNIRGLNSELSKLFDDDVIRDENDELQLSHLDVPEVWELVEPYYQEFIQIYNDICSFNRINYIEKDECLRITWEQPKGIISKNTMVMETTIDSVDGRLSATSFIYNIGGFKQPDQLKLDIVYK
tara:strand:- start:10989 stop:11594 length:606 start_codon:yes stop_codon:yes gene_type:complete